MSTKSNNTGGYLALCITCIVWGTTWVASKVGVKEIPAFQLATIRQFAGGIIFVLFFTFYKKLPLPTKKQFVLLIALAILVFVGANGLSTWSLQFISTGLSSLIGALYPITIVIIELVFLKNKNVNATTFIGLLLGIAGILIVFYENAFTGTTEPGFFFGVFLSLTAMFCWSIGTIIISKNKININPYYSMGWQMLISSFITFFIVIIKGDAIPVNEISLKGWMAVAYLVIAGSLVAFIAFIYSMKKLPTALYSLFAYINPLVAMVVANVLLGEKLNSHIIWGAFVTLLGVFLVNYSLHKSKN